MNTYERIRETRKVKGMTQTELAEKSGYADKSMISRIENGKVDIFLSNLERIAEALNVDPAYLMGWTEDARLEDYASALHAIGIRDQYIMKFGGWKSDSILKSVYRGTLDDFETEAAEKANAYFERQFR